MKSTFSLIIFICSITLAGCHFDDPSDDAGPIVQPIFATLIERDSISSGSYLDMNIGTDAEDLHAKIQSFRQNLNLSFLNIVSNFSSDVTELGDRIPLYNYLLLDQKAGTDSGVQITFEAGRVKTIYLNSGKKLTQWPEKVNVSSSVRVGDAATTLQAKLFKISRSSKYANKFESILLLTKDLSTAYDPYMSKSPQWYFTHSTGKDLWEEVQVHLANGKVNYIIVNRFKYGQ